MNAYRRVKNLVGAAHGNGQLVLVRGKHPVGRSRIVNRLIKALPVGACYRRLDWPWCDLSQIRRALREGEVVFVEISRPEQDIPIKPYRLHQVGVNSSVGFGTEPSKSA